MTGQDAAKRAKELMGRAYDLGLIAHPSFPLEEFFAAALDAAVAEAITTRDYELSIVRSALHDKEKDLLEMLDRFKAQEARLIVAEEAVKERDAEIKRLTKNLCAYAGALGYSLPGDHDGRLSDGTTPHCGLCGPHADVARREERAKLANWSHVCTLEACCIENGIASLSGLPASAPELNTPTLPDDVIRNLPRASAPEGTK